MNNKQHIGRLAMRVEGNLWVAYYALPNTMEGALFLGSIQMAFVSGDKWANKEIFMSLMRDAVSSIIEEESGEAPVWPEPSGVPAPEHEKAGRA